MIGYDITADAANHLFDLAATLEGRDDRPDQLVDRAETLALEDAGDDPAAQAEYFWLIDRLLADRQAHIIAARKAAQTALLRNVAQHGAIRLGDSAYRAAPDAGWEITDVERLTAWIEEMAGWDYLPHVFRLNSSNLRITALRAIAEQAYDDEEMVDAVMDTFVERVPRGDGGLRLDEVYPGKAKWAQRLDHLERDPNRKPKAPS